MSYRFNMGFAQADSLQEALKIALEYTQSQMTEKNIKKTIRDNRYYIYQNPHYERCPVCGQKLKYI